MICRSTSHMVFSSHGLDRLTQWKKIRNDLELSQSPFDDVIELWRKAPIVNPYLDPENRASWPDPWRLVMDLKLDNLAIVLGMLYTLQLTERFMSNKFEIHMSMFNDREYDYFLSIDESVTLDHQTGSVGPYRQGLRKIWSSD